MSLDNTEANEFIWLDLDLKSYEDGSTIKVLLGNRAVSDSAGFEVLPILQSVSGFGVTMGQYTPQALRGSVTIDVSHSSFGYERRFLDLLERYTFQDQAAELRIALDGLDGLASIASYDYRVVTTGRGWKYDPQTETVRLDFETQGIDRRIITKTINSDDFPNAPDASLGRVLPIVFGQDVQVRPYKINNDATPDYAYAATLSTEHPVGGVQQYYAKDLNGDYKAINSVGATGTAYYSLASDTGTPTVFTDLFETAYEFTPTNSFICTSFDIGIRHFGGTWESEFEINIYSHDITSDNPNQSIAVATFNVADYSDPGVGNDTSISLPFPEPLVLSSDSIYWLSITRSNFTTTTDVVVLKDTAAAHSQRNRARDNFEAIWTNAGDADTTRLNVELYGVLLTDTTSAAADSNGLGYASFAPSQRTISGETMPDIDEVDYIVAIDGLRDDPSGTITGSANQLITQPDEAFECISQTWNGSIWSTPAIKNADFTLTTFTSGDITIDGATRGRTSLYRMIEDACRSTQARVALRADGELQTYANGVEQTSVATITDEESEVLSVREDPAEGTVVNSVEMYFARSLITLGLESGTSDGRLTQYLQRYQESDTITQSSTLFGERVLGNETFDYCGNATSAANVAAVILGKWAFPPVYTTIETTLRKHGDVDLLDVVEILHPDLPAFYGTSYDATLPSYDGDEVQQGGMYFKRAKRYRAQAEARQVNWTRGKPVMLQLNCRLLLNSPNDPT